MPYFLSDIPPDERLPAMFLMAGVLFVFVGGVYFFLGAKIHI